MVNQRFLVSVTYFFLFANNRLYMTSQYHNANTCLCNVKMAWHHIDINCNSLRFTVLKLSISENRPCRIHRCPTDTNNWIHWWIQGGAPGTRPPKGPNSFIFDIQILWNVAASEVHGPPTRSTHPYGKSWIRHWNRSINRQIVNQFDLYLVRY